MNGIALTRTAAKRIERIFEHPNEEYSVYIKGQENVEWVFGKTALYELIHAIERGCVRNE